MAINSKESNLSIDLSIDKTISSSNNETTYLIHDNGSRPFKVIVSNSQEKIKVYYE